MTNTLKLKAVMVEKGVTNEMLAGAIGISPQSFSKKLNNHVQFKSREIEKARVYLELSKDQRDAIFFAECVDE